MAAITWDDVLALPNLPPSVVSASTVWKTMVLSRINFVSTDLPGEFNVDNFDGEDGPTTKMARVLMAAHLTLTMLPKPTGGPITEQHELDLGVTYAFTPFPMSAAWYAQTGYGLALWQIIQSSACRIGFVL